MKQKVRFQRDGEWHEAELEVDGRRLRGWERSYQSIEEFVRCAVDFYTSHSLHQHLETVRTLRRSVEKAVIPDEEMNALRGLGLKRIVARLEALEAFELAEAERRRRWDETKDLA